MWCVGDVFLLIKKMRTTHHGPLFQPRTHVLPALHKLVSYKKPRIFFTSHIILQTYRFLGLLAFPGPCLRALSQKTLIIVHALGNFILSSLNTLYSPLHLSPTHPPDMLRCPRFSISPCFWSLTTSHPKSTRSPIISCKHWNSDGCTYHLHLLLQYNRVDIYPPPKSPQCTPQNRNQHRSNIIHRFHCRIDWRKSRLHLVWLLLQRLCLKEWWKQCSGAYSDILDVFEWKLFRRIAAKTIMSFALNAI